MKKTALRILALATVVSGSTLAAPGAASAGGHDVPSSVPDTCYGRLQTVDAKKTYGQILWKEGTISHEADDGYFPFVPVSMVPYGSAGGPDDEHGNRQGISSSFVIDPAGKMRSITHKYSSDKEGNPVAEITENTVIGPGWQGTEDLTYSYGKLYRLTETGRLTRYTHVDGGLKDKTSVFSSGGVGLRTVAFAGETTWKGEEADLLLTTTRDGRLREYIVPVDDPTDWTARNLATSGWGDISQISTSTCGDDGRAITARHDNGRVSTWYDRDAGDFSAADITGGYTQLPALPDSTKTHQ